MKLFNIGFGNFVSLDRIISVLCIDSSPIKRLIHIAKEKGILIDATCGRKTQSVFLMDSGHVVLSALNPEAIEVRVKKEVSDNLD